MSQNDKPGTTRSTRPANGRNKKPYSDADYEVGYGKPPVAGRFEKGRSGNPRGRPRKVKPPPPKFSDAPSEHYLETEAYRHIELLEKGEKVELPMLQAVVRAIAVNAVKGNRLSQKFFLEYVRDEEERQQKRKIENYLHLEKLKRTGEALIEEHKRKGLAPPNLLPHPDDIVLNRARIEAYVNGPETPEEVREYEYWVRMRNFVFLRWANLDSDWTKRRSRVGENKICLFTFMAFQLDRFLPARFRWREGEDVSLMIEYRGLRKKQRERLIQTEWAGLQATRPPSSLSPEQQAEIERIADRFLQDIRRKPSDVEATQSASV